MFQSIYSGLPLAPFLAKKRNTFLVRAFVVTFSKSHPVSFTLFLLVSIAIFLKRLVYWCKIVRIRLIIFQCAWILIVIVWAEKGFFAVDFTWVEESFYWDGLVGSAWIVGYVGWLGYQGGVFHLVYPYSTILWVVMGFTMVLVVVWALSVDKRDRYRRHATSSSTVLSPFALTFRVTAFQLLNIISHLMLHIFPPFARFAAEATTAAPTCDSEQPSDNDQYKDY